MQQLEKDWLPNLLKNRKGKASGVQKGIDSSHASKDSLHT